MDVESRIPHRWKTAGAIALAGAGALALVPFSNTVASLTDSEFANGSFSYTATEWSIESSTDHSNTVPGAWASHDASNIATLSVQLPQLVPGRASYAPFSLRVAAGSPAIAGAAKLKGAQHAAGSSSLANATRMRVVVSPTGACDASSFTGSPNFLVGAASGSTTTMMSPSGANQSATLAAPAPAGQAGAATTLCFEFTLPAPTETAQNILDAFDALNGQSTTVQWTFSGESV